MPEEIIAQATLEMDEAIERLENELSKLRTGRANPAILDKVMVSYYGVPTPLKQIAAINVSEARQLLIKPFDKNSLKDIEVAIHEANLGIAPNNDGENIRLNFPAITEDTRKDLVKEVKGIAENSKVSIRNVRREANDSLKKLDLREDELKGYMDDVQTLTNDYIKKIETITSEKENDLMTV